MAEKVVVQPTYDSTIAALVVDTNCDMLATSLDPVSIALKLVSRGLMSSRQAQDVLDDRVKTRSEKNLAFLNLIKSSPDPSWFSSLLEVIGEERTTEQLKEVLEKSYRAVEAERWRGESQASQMASIPEQSHKSTSGVSAAVKKPLWRVRHTLEVEFLHLKDTLVKFLEETQQPTLKELRECCSYLVETDEVMQQLEQAESYGEVMRIVFQKLCRWLQFSFLEMIADYFGLNGMHTSLDQYRKKLQPVLQMKFDCIETALKEAGVTEDTPPAGMKKIVVRYNLDAGGITLADVATYRQFLSSILEIPQHLLVLISVLYGSLLLELWIPEEFTPQVVRRVEEVWKELWRRKVESIEVGERSFDLLQHRNMEKATLIRASLSVVPAAAASGPWNSVLSSYGRRLYEEYGRHASLQLYVRKHKEADHPSPEALGALEWLLLHHTPKVAEREGKDPLDVLLTTVLMGCCDVGRFVTAIEKCLKDSAVGNRILNASLEFISASYRILCVTREELIAHLSDVAVTKLYLKYHRLHSLQAHICSGVKDPQHLSYEEMERMKEWFKDHMRELKKRIESEFILLPEPLCLILVEAGVTDKEMEKSFPHSQEVVRAIQSSFQTYLASMPEAISPGALLQAANSQRRDIFQLFFEALEEQKADLEPYKSYLREKVPLYQQDLEEVFTSVGAVAMAASTLTTAADILQISCGVFTPVSEAVSVAPAVAIASSPKHSTALSEVEKQFSLLAADMLPSVTKEIAPLANHFASLPVDSSGATIFSAEQAMTVARNLPQYWTWYECAFLKEVTSYFHSNEDAMSSLLKMYDVVRHMSLPECFPQSLLVYNQLAPPPGYTHMQLTLPDHPEDVPMGRLWSLKEQLCSSLALQPYALLLTGYMEGSTHIIFYISQKVTLNNREVATMFAGAKRAGLYPVSITVGFWKAQESWAISAHRSTRRPIIEDPGPQRILAHPLQLEYRFMDLLPLIKMAELENEMEGLPIAETERQETTPPSSQKDQ